MTIREARIRLALGVLKKCYFGTTPTGRGILVLAVDDDAAEIRLFGTGKVDRLKSKEDVFGKPPQVKITPQDVKKHFQTLSTPGEKRDYMREIMKLKNEGRIADEVVWNLLDDETFMKALQKVAFLNLKKNA